MFYPTNLLQMRDIEGVTPGGVATINLIKGPRYRNIVVLLQDEGSGSTAAPTVAAITNSDIQITLGSKVIRRALGSQIDLINTTNGSNYASYSVAGAANGGGIRYLPIFFEEPWRKRADYQNGLACETGWLGQNDVFQLSIPIQSTTTTPVLGCFAVVDAFSSGSANPIMKWYPTDSNTSSNILTLNNLFQGAPAADLVESLSLLNTSDGKFVSNVYLTLNNAVVYDNITFDMQTAFLNFNSMNPTGTSLTGSNAYHIVFDHDDLFESLRLVSSITASQLQMTFSASSTGSQRMIMQRLGLPTA